jgi:squalene synthase HpnC
MSTAIASVEEWSGKDRADENFPVGSALIRRDLRPHVHAYYNFARNADDIADSPTLVPEDKIYRLDVMEAVLLGKREDGSPSALALRASLAQTRVPARHATDLLIAFRQDATKNRYATWDELLDYCRHSAMPVGRYVLDLHEEAEGTYEPSDALCASLQVLNHLQDCQKDFLQLDRSYLPHDLLSRFHGAVADVAQEAETVALSFVFATLLDQVERLNTTAADLPRRVRDRRLRLETAVIVGLARRLTRRLRHGDPIARRIKLSKMDALFSLLGALRFMP